MNRSADAELTRRWSEDRWRKFHSLLARVMESNPFQRNRAPALARFPEWRDFEDFLSSCPFTSKEELARDRLENPPYGTNLSFPEDDYLKFHQTSGTLGKPMAWLDTSEIGTGCWEIGIVSCRRLEWTEAVVATSRFPLVRSWERRGQVGTKPLRRQEC